MCCRAGLKLIVDHAIALAIGGVQAGLTSVREVLNAGGLAEYANSLDEATMGSACVEVELLEQS